MSEKKYFKGFSLDEKGCVQGAYPCFSSVVESQVKKITELENEFVMKTFRNLHIDTDVLMKQKAEIDRLSFENEQLKARFEKLLDFVVDRTEECDVCELTDTCINSEGVCPFAWSNRNIKDLIIKYIDAQKQP